MVPIGSMYAIYGNIHHQYTPNVSIYTSTMDPMGFIMTQPLSFVGLPHFQRPESQVLRMRQALSTATKYDPSLSIKYRPLEALTPKVQLVGSFKHVFIFHNISDVILPIDELICFKMVNKNHQPVNVNDVNVSWRSLKHWDLGSIYCGGMGVGYYKLANWHRISSGKLT